MKQLDRLLFEQGGDCFFCSRPLAKADASIEHLHAQANGGTSAEENVVACCKALNALLSNKPLKEKFAIVLRQKRGFQCPAALRAEAQAPPPAQATAVTPPAPLPERSQATKLGPAAKKVPKLAAVTPLPPPAPKKSSTAAITCPTCKSSVPSAVGQVDFVCPKCHAGGGPLSSNVRPFHFV